ncbi:helix-turn-helix domain-containing protein [Granulicella sp. 5B5]|uniref:helix-turn-helix domain-containing protein n=1 Tax=Granulicella sp. 5B5 TaxID=1617967 RepID=UPI0015F3E1EE|nr:helix-turn-helix transcriptional regulator [Granulicella sp. 5B5]QMV19573.1 helix-turn-helix domain-containing protein [Granulicella sp. 5B5]
MKKNDPRWTDASITHGSGNVFIDLGFDEAEAHVLLMRADLMIEIEKLIVAKGWTQAEAAKRMGITQPRVSKLLKRKWDDFSLDMLLTLATRLGIRSELKLAA